MPLRFSVLTLVSEAKVSLFDDTILEFAAHLLAFELNKVLVFRRPRDEYEIEDFLLPGNEEAFVAVRKAVYVIDEICKKKTSWARPSTKHRKGNGLIKDFTYKMENYPDINAEIETECRDQNFLRQRRVYVTPSLILFKPNAREQTCRVLRQFHRFKEYFFRLTLSDDRLQKMHYGSIKERLVLCD